MLSLLLMYNNAIHIRIPLTFGLFSLSAGSPVYPIVIGGLKVYNLGEVSTYSGIPLNGHPG